jgi:hypothetical protein
MSLPGTDQAVKLLSTVLHLQLCSMAQVDDMFCALYTDLLTSAAADHPSARARVICAYLIGLAARRSIHPGRTEHLDEDLAIMTGRPRPIPPGAPEEPCPAQHGRLTDRLT